MSQNPEPRIGPVGETQQSTEARDEPHASERESAGTGARVLRRSRQDRVIAGVCGGLGRHLDIDPILFRIAFLVSLLAGGVGLVAYIVLWIAVPEYASPEDERDGLAASPSRRGQTGLIAGGVLIVFGILILLREFIPWFDARVIGALFLIGIGAAIVIRGMQRD